MWHGSDYRPKSVPRFCAVLLLSGTAEGDEFARSVCSRGKPALGASCPQRLRPLSRRFRPFIDPA